MEQVTGQRGALGRLDRGLRDGRHRRAGGKGHTRFPIGCARRTSDLRMSLGRGMDQRQPLVGRLGRHKEGRGCLYIKRLSDVDEGCCGG
jgi:hypothetical protein